MARTWPFNAANYLKVGAAPANLNFNSPSGQGWSLSAWLKLNRTDGSDQTIMSDWVGGAGGGGLLMRTISGNLRMFVISTTGSGREAISVHTMTAGLWYHIGATWDGGNNRVYLQGIEEGVVGDGGGQATPTDPLGWYFGVRSSLSNPLDGTLCEIAMWNDILTEAEFRGLYRGASPLMLRRGPDSTFGRQLQGYWPTLGPWDQGADWSGKGNHLTTVGTLAIADHAPTGPWVPQAMDGGYEWNPVASAIKTVQGVLRPSVKTELGLANASMKTWGGLA